ncbi:MAG: hypothetical protein HY925_05200 [Elusimicrobia bacterium]|nr:hypothetical protein [Elusimicrobiota bacterium]
MTLRQLGLAALLALSGCGEPAQGIARLRTGDVFHPKFYSKLRKVFFVDGAYPRKTKLGVYDLATGKSEEFYFPGYRIGETFAPVGSGDAALVNATISSDKESGSQLILVSLKDGSVQRRIADTTGLEFAELGRPSWTARAFFLKGKEGHVYLSAFDSATGDLEPPKLVGDFVARRAAFADKTPLLVIEAFVDGRPAYVTYDLLAGRVARTEPAPATAACLVAAERGAILCRAQPADRTTVLESLDAQAGGTRALGAIAGLAESVLPVDGRVLVTAKDPLAVPDSDRRWAARNLTVLREDGGAAETVRWTKRGERLFGRDGETGRLLFAATEPMSLWAIDDKKEAWGPAVGELDRRAGELWNREATYMAVAGLAILFFFWIAKSSRPACKNC